MAILVNTIARFNIGRWAYRVGISCARYETIYELTKCANRAKNGETISIEVVNTGETLFQVLNCPDIPLWLAEEVEEGLYNV